MTELVILILVITSFLISMIIGNYMYKIENKKVFNYLNTFPFEMESKKNNGFTLLFRILLGLFIVLTCIDILYLFIFHFDSALNTRFLGGVLLLDALLLFGLFIINGRLYKGHIFISSSIFVLTSIGYLMLGYISIVNEKPLYVTIISFVVGSLLLIVIFLPLLKEGFKLEVESSEENYITSRKKFNLLVFNEWINIVLVIILLILYTTIYL